MARTRNLEWEALAELDSPDIKQVTNPARIGKALKIIRSVCPDVSADEIRRRAANYRRAWPNATITSTALANNWGRFDRDTPAAPRLPSQEELRRQKIAALEAELKTELTPSYRAFVMLKLSEMK